MSDSSYPTKIEDKYLYMEGTLWETTKNPSILYELVKTRPKLDEELCLAYWIAQQKLKTHDRIRGFIFDMMDDSIGRYLEQHSHLLPEPCDSSPTTKRDEKDV